MQIFNTNDYFIPCFKINEQEVEQIKTPSVLIIDKYNKFNGEDNKFEYLIIDDIKVDKKILSFIQIQNNLEYIKDIICRNCYIKDITLFKKFKSLKKINFIDCKFENDEYCDDYYMNLTYWLQCSQYQEVSNVLNDDIEIMIDDKNKEQLLTNYTIDNIENINDLLIDIRDKILKNNIGHSLAYIKIKSYKSIDEEFIEDIDKEMLFKERWFSRIQIITGYKYASRIKKLRTFNISFDGEIYSSSIHSKKSVEPIEYIDDDVYLINYYSKEVDELGSDKILIISDLNSYSIINVIELLKNNFMIINPKSPYICELRNYYKSEIICNLFGEPLFYLINGVYFPYDLIERIFSEINLYTTISSELIFELKLHLLLTPENICVKNLTKLLLFENRTFEENSKSIHNHLLQYFGFMLIKEIIKEKYICYHHENIEDSIKETLLYRFKQFIKTINGVINEILDYKYIHLFYEPLLKGILENKLFENIKDEYIKILYVGNNLMDDIIYETFIKEIKEICYKYLSLESSENIILKKLITVDVKISNLEKYLIKSPQFDNSLDYDIDYISKYINKERKYSTIEIMLIFGFNHQINQDIVLNYIIDILNNDEYPMKKLQNIISSLFCYMFLTNKIYIEDIFYNTKLTNEGKLNFIVCLNNISHNKSNLNLLKPNLEFDRIIKEEYEHVKILKHNDFYYGSSYYDDCSYIYEYEEYYYQYGCGYVNVEKEYENLLLEKIYDFETNILNININFKHICTLIYDWLKKEPSLDSIRTLLENQILLLPPELKNFKQYFNKSTPFTRDQIKITKLHSVNYFQDLLDRIDDQMNFDFTSILYFNDNITDCSQSIIDEIDCVDKIMMENLTQIICYRNYLTNIKTNINYYSINQKLTDEEIKKIINMILEYNFY